MKPIHIVKFSGGAASSFVGWHIAKKYGRKNVMLVRHNTGIEHPDTERFLKECSEYIGIPITDISDGRDLYQVAHENNAVPSDRFRFCRRILKIEPWERFVKGLKLNDVDFISYTGLGVDEWKRVQKTYMLSIQNGYLSLSPLVELRMVSNDCKKIIQEQWKIELPSAYKVLKHNNCIPCFLAGVPHFYQIWKHYPCEYGRAVKLEDEIGHTVLSNRNLGMKDVSLRYFAENVFPDYSEEMFKDNRVPCECWSK